ncbi:hypothetical protein [Gallibacterium sp. ZY190522]
MIRISATTLEAYRRWLDNEDATIEDMVAYLDRKIEPTKAMMAGTAFHKLLETKQGNLTVETVDGFTFDFSEIDSDVYIPKIKEFKFTVMRRILDEDVTFVGVVDAMDSNTVFDHKLTSSIDVEKNYEPSMQWRAYLSWLNLDHFTYNLFRQYNPAATPDTFLIKEAVTVSFHRYEDMDLDVENMAKSLIIFIKEYAPHLINRE